MGVLDVIARTLRPRHPLAERVASVEEGLERLDAEVDEMRTQLARLDAKRELRRRRQARRVEPEEG